MTVVTKQSGAESKQHLRVLVAGRPGSGLSPMGAAWPRPYFLLTSGSLAWVQDDVAYTRVDSVDALMGAVEGLSAAPEARTQALGVSVETLVIDTLDGLDHLFGDNPSKLRRLLQVITNLPLHVVLLCHVRAVDDRVEPLLSIPDDVTTFVDVALLLGGTGADTAQAWPTAQAPWVIDRTQRLSPVLPATTFPSVLLGGSARADVERPAATHPAPAAAPPPPAPAPPPPPSPSPSPSPEPTVVEAEADEEDDDDENSLPRCSTQGPDGGDERWTTDLESRMQVCLGRVESSDSLDLSDVRFSAPMCGPCGKLEYEARPKVLPKKRAAKAAAPAAKAAPRPPVAPATLEQAGLPHGERVGQIPPPTDESLRDFLRS